jgi:predicted anti-sigma-YlaC factor YlaD
MTCPATVSDLGAYVLGALEPHERERFEAHLDRCPACLAEFTEFADIPGLLDRVRPEDLQPVAVTPSPELFDRVSAAARATSARPSRTRRWILAAAAVLALLGAGVGVVVWAAGQGSDTVTAAAGPVRATVVASAQGDGSSIDVAVAGLRPGETCRIVAVDTDGVDHPAGEWPVSDDGGGHWRGWADVQRSALQEVVLFGDGGRELIRVPF